MDLKIRKGEKKDLPDVLKLIKELAKYENAEEEDGSCCYIPGCTDVTMFNYNETYRNS